MPWSRGLYVCLKAGGGWCALEQREDGGPWSRVCLGVEAYMCASRRRMVCLRAEGGWWPLE